MERFLELILLVDGSRTQEQLHPFTSLHVQISLCITDFSPGTIVLYHAHWSWYRRRAVDNHPITTSNDYVWPVSVLRRDALTSQLFRRLVLDQSPAE
jgi:hypothetical protein